MSKRRRGTFISLTIIVWSLLAFTLWSLLDTLQVGCNLQERNSGLSAECFAPAAVDYIALFMVAFLADLARVLAVIWRSTPDKE